MPHGMDAKQKVLPPGWDARLGLNGRIYYCSNNSRTVQILPPPEVWRCTHSLPYGWEMAIDYENKNYYINHLTQSVSYEDPRTEDDQSSHHESDSNSIIQEQVNPVPRRYDIKRDEKLGFGFIAGSEKPVVIRSVTPGGPSDGKLLRDDQIVKIDSENVMLADREHVIDLIRGKNDTVVLTVLQPKLSANSCFLKPAKKIARHSDRPKVRFADDIIVNGQERAEGSSPLLISPGVLRIHLENNQNRSFQFLPDTTAGDAVSAICEKLGFRDPNLFSLVLTPHDEDFQSIDNKPRKSSSRSANGTNDNFITSSWSTDSLLVAPWDCLSKVVNNPSMRHHSCHFRLEFMPKDFHKLARDDSLAFRYLYQQCVNDVISGEVYAEDLSRDEVIKLSNIQMQEFIQSSMPKTENSSVERESSFSTSGHRKFRFPPLNNRITLKYIEKEYGLRRFLPPSLLSRMQEDSAVARYVRKAIQQQLKNNSSIFGQNATGMPSSPLFSPGGSTESVIMQLRLQYLKVLSPKHLFGGRYFSASMQAIMESDTTLLIGHHYGISQVINSKTKMVSVIAEFQHITSFGIAPCPAEASRTTVTISFGKMDPLVLSMEPQSAHNLAFMVAGYCRVYGNVEMVLTLPLAESTTAPLYFGPHKVKPSLWNYPPVSTLQNPRASTSDVRLMTDITSPSYFYCDFSEPITPAVLSQETPELDLFRADENSKNGIVGLKYEAGSVLSPPSDKFDRSDSNNNNSFQDSGRDLTYEEIPDMSSLPESPISSLSTGQFSDLSPSHSPRFEPPPPQNKGTRNELTVSGIEVRVDVQPRCESADDDEDWNELMNILEKKNSISISHSSLPEADGFARAPEVFSSPAESLSESASEQDFSNIIAPPPPESRNTSETSALKSSRSEPESLDGHVTHRSVTASSSSNTDEMNDNEFEHSYRMSSFKPNHSELKVFTQVAESEALANSPTSGSTAGSSSSAIRSQSSSGIENVQDPDTRRKLQETEDLIKYFREKREEMAGNAANEETTELAPPTLPCSSSESMSDRFQSEIDIPVVTSDIASGNKRLRKAEKAASKNRKSWAGDDTLNRKVSIDDPRPLSMSNPDLSGSTMHKKNSKGFFRRLFGERKRRSRSMYSINGSGHDISGKYDLAYDSHHHKNGRRFRFSTPKLRLRRAFTFSFSGRKDRKSVIPTTDGPQKSHRFRFRPFTRKSKSHGILVISEPSDNVRGVDLLPSGKYTVAGTMFQVNGNASDSEVITVENESRRGSRENITEEDSNLSGNVDTTIRSDFSGPEANTSGTKLREVSPRTANRPVSFSTFHQPLPGPYDGMLTDPVSKLPFIAERRRKVDSPKSPRSVHLSQTSLSASLTSNSASTMDKSEDLSQIPTSDNAKRQRPMTLPANFSSDGMLDTDRISGQKLIRPTKPSRKLIPANIPTVSEEVPSKIETLPLNIPPVEPNATSTPIASSGQAIVKRKSTKNHRAPPPPIQFVPHDGEIKDEDEEEEEKTKGAQVEMDSDKVPEAEAKDSKINWEEDEESPDDPSENSLVTEIFSYLESSAIKVKDTDEQPEMRDVTTPEIEPDIYDEDYIMPGVKPEVQVQETVEEDDTTKQHQREMYQLFYSDMMADPKLSLEGLNDETDVDDVITEEDEREDTEEEVNSDDSYASKGNADAPPCEEDSDDVIQEKVEAYLQETFSPHQDAGSDVSSIEMSERSEESNQDNDPLETTVENLENFPPQRLEELSTTESSSVANSDASSECSTNTMSSDVPRKMSPMHHSYFSYHHLITPVAFEKTLSGPRHVNLTRKVSTSGTKPPLPPKPIFH